MVRSDLRYFATVCKENVSSTIYRSTHAIKKDTLIVVVNVPLHAENQAQRKRRNSQKTYPDSNSTGTFNTGSTKLIN